MRLYYTLTLLDAVVLSRDNTTGVSHSSLGFISGSAILGALANRYYPTLTQEQAWRYFHSGDCRFGPAYPLKDKELCLPTPAAWHGEKLDKNALHNLAASDFERKDTVQYTQKRGGFLTSQGETAKVEQSLVTKTALSAEADSFGRVKEGQLYNYSALQAEQTFAGWVDVPEADRAWFEQALAGVHRIGRARGTEFGRVQINLSQPNSDLTAIKTTPQDSLVIWCLSPLAVTDVQGLPKLTPNLSDLHPSLPNIALNTERTFIRSHQKSLFNRQRGGFDGEQTVIEAGSVLVYDLKANGIRLGDIEQKLSSLLNEGCGLHRQLGYGWLAINPAWANNANLSTTDESRFAAITFDVSDTNTDEKNEPTSTLTFWAQAKADHLAAIKTREIQRLTWLETIRTAYDNARSYTNTKNAHTAGPSTSQWRRLDAEVKLLPSNDNERWEYALFKDDNTRDTPPLAIASIKSDTLGWGIQWSENGQLTTFTDWLKNYCKHDNGPQTAGDWRSLLEILCRYDLSTHPGLKRSRNEYPFNASSDSHTNGDAS